MPYPTIIGLEQAQADQTNFLTLIEKDQASLTRLSKLSAMGKTITTPEEETALAESFESIVNTTPSLMDGWSLEAFSASTLLDQIKQGIKRLIDVIVRNVKRFVAWIETKYKESSMYRERVKQQAKDVEKLLDSKKNAVFKPVKVKANQVHPLTIGGRFPTNVVNGINTLAEFIHLQRTGKRRTSMVELLRVIKDYTGDKKFYPSVLKRLDGLHRTLDIPNALMRTPASLLGGAVFRLNTSIITKPKAQYRYSIENDGLVAKEDQIIDMTTHKALKDNLDAATELLKEVDLLGELIKKGRTELSMFGLVVMSLEKMTAAETDTDTATQLSEVTAVLIYTLNSLSLFPSVLYTHGLKVAASQINLIKAIATTGSESI